MSNQSPDEIRADIERTRASISHDVDEIGRTVSPSNVVQRQKDKAKGALSDLKEKVMGSDDEPGGYPGYPPEKTPSRFAQAGDGISEAAGTARDAVGGAVHSAGESISHAPQAARRQMQGNPLAVGLIAFGVGWLAASLVPSSRREQDLALAAQQQAQPLLDDARQTAQQLVEDFKPAAQHAVDEVRSTAQDGVAAVRAEGQDAAAHLKEDAAHAKHHIQEQRSSGA